MNNPLIIDKQHFAALIAENSIAAQIYTLENLAQVIKDNLATFEGVTSGVALSSLGTYVEGKIAMLEDELRKQLSASKSASFDTAAKGKEIIKQGDKSIESTGSCG